MKVIVGADQVSPDTGLLLGYIRHDYVVLRFGESDPSQYFRDDEGHYHAQDCRGCEIARRVEAQSALDRAARHYREALKHVIEETMNDQPRVSHIRDVAATGIAAADRELAVLDPGEGDEVEEILRESLDDVYESVESAGT